jgi:hypothetical protein
MIFDGPEMEKMLVDPMMPLVKTMENRKQI